MSIRTIVTNEKLEVHQNAPTFPNFEELTIEEQMAELWDEQIGADPDAYVAEKEQVLSHMDVVHEALDRGDWEAAEAAMQQISDENVRQVAERLLHDHGGDNCRSLGTVSR